MEKFGSKTSFIMASVGSAVGLGNLFRFPALASRYGSIFILAYLPLLILSGVPLLMSELALGRLTGKSAVGAMKNFSKIGRFTGALTTANSFFIMTYYCPLFSSVIMAAVFSLRLLWATAPERVFTDLLYSQNLAIPLLFLISAWSLVMLCFGSAERIGKISTFAVAFASASLLFLAIFSLFCGGDISSFIRLDPTPLLSADFWRDLLGQVFFSLSIMVGVMVSYGSFLPKGENILSCALIISFSDLAVSLCATVIFVAFGGGGADSDILTCFSVYPAAFCALGRGFGAVLSLLFYSALALLCLASVFSYLKAVCHGITDVIGVNEIKTGVLLTVISAFLGIFLLGRDGLGRLAFLDGEIVPLLMLVSGLLETVVLIKIAKKYPLPDEINRGGKMRLSAGFYRFSIGFLCPFVILLLFLMKILF